MSKELERAMDYREQAARLLRQVENQPNDGRKALIFDMAANYIRMANQIEEIHRIDVTPRG